MAKIDSDVLEVLSKVECSGDRAYITEQIDRKMYLRVNRVLTALGGKWSRKAKAHVFEPFDWQDDAVAGSIIADAVTAGEYVDPRKEYQFFETPSDIVDMLIGAVDVESGMTVLEPSAGKGAIARPVRELGAYVECIEANQNMAYYLLQEGFASTWDDFLDVPVPAEENRVDRVLMNPPFSRSQDIQHVRRAYDWLKSDGRLAAVMGVGWTFRNDRRAVEFREWLDDVGGEYSSLPEGSFKASGTAVSTVLVSIRKELGLTQA